MDKNHYLGELKQCLEKVWPENETVRIVCHGHSMPCGYTAAHIIKPLDAYPHLLRERLAVRFPTSMVNVIVTARGGEASQEGALRFERDVLSLRPHLVTIDYGRNDRFLPMDVVRDSWKQMIEAALGQNIRILLLTPAIDCGFPYFEQKNVLRDEEVSQMIRELSTEYQVGLADVEERFLKLLELGYQRSDFLVSVNHLNRRGHEVIADALMEWFPFG